VNIQTKKLEIHSLYNSSIAWEISSEEQTMAYIMETTTTLNRAADLVARQAIPTPTSGSDLLLNFLSNPFQTQVRLIYPLPWLSADNF
jgi:hypothetical protein